MIKQYIQIIKPGIILGNLISAIGGFFLASRGKLDFFLLIMTIMGLSLIIASACICNNYIDRDIDAIMERTKKRILVQKFINPKVILFYVNILGLTGIAILYLTTNILTTLLAIIGFIIYVGIYSLYMKRNSIYSTLIGSLSGAVPPIIGYCAINKSFDTGAFILLAIFSLWQIPHSYAIAIFRLEDYQSAHIPVLPVVKGVTVTKKHINMYILAFIVATMLLTFNGYVGYTYLIVTTTAGLWWLSIAFSGYNNKTVDNQIWARKLFLFSIIMIICVSIMISIDFQSYVPIEKDKEKYIVDL
ncbi:heme o synthase [Candidatus Profftia sp. (ex Adelges kitamiensis)]|uniref:heme o synthase n=1 Tax=Candidatus Profftia sp. (ex Adelges kitamiensis) TaxID=2864218 RepID=UPI001CE33357|nr:heme o synthase [Candidatus Profftia sp. (ex Adelges kitamiensis)]